MPGLEDARSLSERLAAEATAVMTSLLHHGEPVAVVDFPYSDNFGDAAIWLGQNALLASLGHHRRYVCDVGRYRADDLRAAHPSGPILLHGGGNFGDYWPEHQALRAQVLRDFPSRRIVQLPQTVGFQLAANKAQVAREMGAHPDFTLLVRDATSLSTGLELGLDTQICPDSATHLGPLRRRPTGERRLMVLARTDHESGGLRSRCDAEPAWRPLLTEWEFTKGYGLAWRLAKTGPRLMRRLPARPGLRTYAQTPLALTYDAMAAACLRAATTQLSRASVLVTDRLHAHVIAALLGIPNIVVDNNYGKVRSIFEHFTHTSAVSEMADSVDDALERAAVLTAGST